MPCHLTLWQLYNYTIIDSSIVDWKKKKENCKLFIKNTDNKQIENIGLSITYFTKYPSNQDIGIKIL